MDRLTTQCTATKKNETPESGSLIGRVIHIPCLQMYAFFVPDLTLYT